MVGSVVADGVGGVGGWVVAGGVGGVFGWVVAGGIEEIIGWVVTGGWAGGDPVKGRSGVEIVEREGVVDRSELSRGDKSGELGNAGGWRGRKGANILSSPRAQGIRGSKLN